jgi:hypothetical protein
MTTSVTTINTCTRVKPIVSLHIDMHRHSQIDTFLALDDIMLIEHHVDHQLDAPLKDFPRVSPEASDRAIEYDVRLSSSPAPAEMAQSAWTLPLKPRKPRNLKSNITPRAMRMSRLSLQRQSYASNANRRGVG